MSPDVPVQLTARACFAGQDPRWTPSAARSTHAARLPRLNRLGDDDDYRLP
jgi:hypothetical protein